MKKRAILTAVIALTAAIFAGCQKKDVVIDVAALADDLKNTVPFVDTLDQPSAAAFKQIYQIDDVDIAEKKVYVSSGATAEEIAVFESVSEDAAERIHEAVNTRIADNLESFEDYNPDEQKKLSDPVIVTTGKYVILCVSDDNDAARQCIEKYTK